MRVVQNIQMKLGEIDVSQIKFDLRSRDDIPKVLRGLQYLYLDEALRQKVFALLESEIAPKVDKRTGRPGMTLWRPVARSPGHAPGVFRDFGGRAGARRSA